MSSDPDITHEESAGCALVWKDAVLLIRVRAQGFELPKGHVEPGESAVQAAVRELIEETGLASDTPLRCVPLAVLSYEFDGHNGRVCKRVHYFTAFLDGHTPEFGPKPLRTKELRWVSAPGMVDISFPTEDLRQVVEKALKDAE